MSLRTIMNRKKIEDKRSLLEALEQNFADFESREAELEAAITETATDEEEKAVETEVDKLETEKAEAEKKRSLLLSEIETLESEIRAIEEREPKTVPMRKEEKFEMERGNKMNMNTVDVRNLPMNTKAFDSLPMETRNTILAQDDVKTFLANLRSMKGNTRAISGGALTIPTVMLDIIAQNMFRYSKLINRVRVRNISGYGRQTIVGTIPEAVWTEMCGAINELSFVFNQVVTDGFKVAGYIPVCNSLLEDSDADLAGTIVEMISEALGLAKDKAILYGKGAAAHMPMGIVTRLAQTQQPSDYPANTPAWENLSATNVIKIDGSKMTAAEFFAALATATGNTYNVYARGRQFWAMNSKTYAQLKSKLITFTASGDLVARFPGVMPVIDGDVDVLEFIPDGDIIGGYGDLYLWVQRSGMEIESSTEVQFIQDNTVFRGKERADGMPLIPRAFVAININNVSPTTTMTFAADNANDSDAAEITLGDETLAPVFAPGTQSYTVTAKNASDKISVTAAQAAAQIAISYDGAPVRNGGTVTYKADSKAYPLTVSVTNGNKTKVYTISVTKSA